MVKQKEIVARVIRSDWLALRSDWDICLPDIFIRGGLVEGYIIKEELNGYAHLHIFWNNNQVIDGWVPSTMVD